MQGPSPKVYCSSSISSDTPPVVHSEAWGTPSARIITPAPVTATRSAATWHSGPGADGLAPAATSRSRMRAKRSAATSDRPIANADWGGPAVALLGLLAERQGAPRGPGFAHPGRATTDLDLPYPTGKSFGAITSGANPNGS